MVKEGRHPPIVGIVLRQNAEVVRTHPGGTLSTKATTTFKSVASQGPQGCQAANQAIWSFGLVMEGLVTKQKGPWAGLRVCGKRRN